MGVLRKGVVLIVGTVVILIGIIMLVAPGPGLVVIPAGIGILALEFEWAKRLLGTFWLGVKNVRAWISVKTERWFKKAV